MLQFSDGETFAIGAIQYLYAPATANETTNRIQLPILLEIEESVKVLAVVDTGAPYPILDPTIALAIGFSSELAIERISMLVRGKKLEGSLILFKLKIRTKLLNFGWLWQGKSRSSEIIIKVLLEI